MDALRRERVLCDVIVFVGGQREIYAHRCVLAAMSRTLCDELTLEERGRTSGVMAKTPEHHHHLPVVNGTPATAPTTNGAHPPANGGSESPTAQPAGNQGRPQVYLEFPNVDYDCFDALIRYGYTSK